MSAGDVHQVILQIDRSAVERIEQLLAELGCLCTTLEDAANEDAYELQPGEAPGWQRVTLKALFDCSLQIQPIMDVLEEHLPIGCEFTHEMLSDRPWEREWMQHFEPQQISERFWVCPGWCEPPDPGAVNLILDPGLAFGTGTHPTTALCLHWLAHHDIAGLDMVDYGCGSGILGIAAVLLGARKVTGIDHDPQALLASRQNAQRNGLEGTRLVAMAPHELVDGPVDLVVANILAGPLVELSPVILSLLRPGGKLLLSGILTSQAEQVRRAYEPLLRVDEVIRKEDWVCIVGTFKPLLD